MDSVTRLALRHRLRSIVEPTVHAQGCELVAVEITGDIHGKIVRVFVDRPGGVTIDDCAKISRNVSPELDVEDPIEGEYRLEVSSPDIERPVETVADFQRFVGLRAKVRLLPGAPRRRFTGEILGADEGSVRILADDTEHVLDFAQIDRAYLNLDLEQFTELQAQLAESSLETANIPQGERP